MVTFSSTTHFFFIIMTIKKNNNMSKLAFQTSQAFSGVCVSSASIPFRLAVENEL